MKDSKRDRVLFTFAVVLGVVLSGVILALTSCTSGTAPESCTEYEVPPDSTSVRPDTLPIEVCVEIV